MSSDSPHPITPSDSPPFVLDQSPDQEKAQSKELIARPIFRRALGVSGVALIVAYASQLGGLLDTHNGALSAVAAIVVAWFTYTLARSTSDQLRLTREALALSKRMGDSMDDTARRELRAYVAFETAKCLSPSPAPPYPDVADIAAYRLVFSNSGKTPAHHVMRVGFPILEVAAFPPPIPPKPGSFGSKGTLGSGRKMSFDTGPLLLTPQEKDDIRFGRKIVYIHGFVRYEDAFGSLRLTYFRLQRALPEHEVDGHEVVIANEGNEST